MRFWGNPRKLEPGDIALLENNLGLFELQNGRLERAQAELRSAIDQFHGIPEPPIELSAAEVNLAVVERLQGHPQAAGAALERARDVALRTAGPGHLNFRAIQIELAYQRGLDGDPSGAEAELRNFLQQTGTPERSVDRPRVLLALGQVLTLAGNPTEAEPLLRELLKLRLQGSEAGLSNCGRGIRFGAVSGAAAQDEGGAPDVRASLQDFRDYLGPNVWATKTRKFV